VGGRMLQGAARMLISQFFTGLIRQAAGDEAEAAPTPSAGWWMKLLRMLGIGR